DDSDPGPPCGCGRGMPVYSLLQMPASLRITDIPGIYRPPLGPELTLRFTYNQRDTLQPQVFSTGNIGSKWTLDWASWVVDNPTTSVDVDASVSLRGGGSESYSLPTGGVFPAHFRSRAVLVKVSASPIRYERRLRDGGIEVF